MKEFLNIFFCYIITLFVQIIFFFAEYACTTILCFFIINNNSIFV